MTSTTVQISLMSTGERGQQNMTSYLLNGGHMPSSLMTFDTVPLRIRMQLAVHLEEENSVANWQILAEELRCPPAEANFIKARRPAAPHRSCTLLFFEEYCQKIRISDVIRALRRIENLPCVQILEIFLAPKRIFITCTIENGQHFRYVARLCENLKQRRFKIGVDQSETSLERTIIRFNKADYVLILISALYHRVITTSTSPAESKYACNARYIYHDLVLPAVCQSADGGSNVNGAIADPTQLRPQCIVVVMPGAKSQHVPTELRDAGIPTFHLPGDELELLKHLS